MGGTKLAGEAVLNLARTSWAGVFIKHPLRSFEIIWYYGVIIVYCGLHGQTRVQKTYVEGILTLNADTLENWALKVTEQVEA